MNSTLIRHLTFRVPEDLFQDVQSIREQNHINIGSLVRTYLRDFVKNQKNTK